MLSWMASTNWLESPEKVLQQPPLFRKESTTAAEKKLKLRKEGDKTKETKVFNGKEGQTFQS